MIPKHKSDRIAVRSEKTLPTGQSLWYTIPRPKKQEEIDLIIERNKQPLYYK